MAAPSRRSSSSPPARRLRAGRAKGAHPLRRVPLQNFGAYGGRIVKVSRTVLTPADVPAPVELKEPAYRVTAALDRPDVDAHGGRVPLRPDMLLRADIVLDSRALMDWLLNPLLGAGARIAAVSGGS